MQCAPHKHLCTNEVITLPPSLDILGAWEFEQAFQKRFDLSLYRGVEYVGYKQLQRLRGEN